MKILYNFNSPENTVVALDKEGHLMDEQPRESMTLYDFLFWLKKHEPFPLEFPVSFRIKLKEDKK